MRKAFISLLTIGFLLSSCTPKLGSGKMESEWQPLFNGKDLSDWIVKIHHHATGINYGNTFRAEDGMIKVRYDEYGATFDDQFGHLYFKTPFSHYHLKLDYHFSGNLHPGAPDYTLLNSGIMFHSQDPYTIPVEQDWPISIEMQFLAGLRDGEPRATGNMCSPGTHIVYQGELVEQHIIKSSAKTYPKDEWVHAELIVYGDSLIQHIINGEKVLEYSGPQIGGKVVNRFDPKIKIDGKKLTSGYIALQSEGQPIEFKNIYLKDLSVKE